MVSRHRPSRQGSPAAAAAGRSPPPYTSRCAAARSSPCRRRRGRAAPSRVRGRDRPAATSSCRPRPRPVASASGRSRARRRIPAVGIADRRHGPEGPVVKAVEAGLVDVDHAQAQAGAGLVERDGARAAVGDVIVTGGWVVTSARRVTSMRSPTKINASARGFQIANASTLLATWCAATLLMVDLAQPRMICTFPTGRKKYLARRPSCTLHFECLTKLSNVVAYACRHSRAEDRQHAPSNRRRTNQER